MIYCLDCGGNSCTHVQRSRRRILTHRQLTVLHQLLDGRGLSNKEIAYNLGITEGSVKVYLKHITDKLRWVHCSSGRLRLWAMIHAESLGLTVPTIKDFE